jgi:hypothetical protein
MGQLRTGSSSTGNAQKEGQESQRKKGESLHGASSWAFLSPTLNLSCLTPFYETSHC